MTDIVYSPEIRHIINRQPRRLIRYGIIFFSILFIIMLIFIFSFSINHYENTGISINRQELNQYIKDNILSLERTQIKGLLHRTKEIYIGPKDPVLETKNYIKCEAIKQGSLPLIQRYNFFLEKPVNTLDNTDSISFYLLKKVPLYRILINKIPF